MSNAHTVSGRLAALVRRALSGMRRADARQLLHTPGFPFADARPALALGVPADRLLAAHAAGLPLRAATRALATDLDVETLAALHEAGVPLRHVARYAPVLTVADMTVCARAEAPLPYVARTVREGWTVDEAVELFTSGVGLFHAVDGRRRNVTLTRVVADHGDAL